VKRRGIDSSEMSDIASLISFSLRNSGPVRVKTMLFFETCVTVLSCDAVSYSRRKNFEFTTL